MNKLLIDFRQTKKPKRRHGREAIIHYLFSNYRNGAKHRGHEFCLSEKQFTKLIFDKCFYCGAEPNSFFHVKNRPFIVHNAVDRVDSYKGYSIDNCQTLCYMCNWMKQRFTSEAFLVQCNKIVILHPRVIS